MQIATKVKILCPQIDRAQRASYLPQRLDSFTLSKVCLAVCRGALHVAAPPQTSFAWPGPLTMNTTQGSQPKSPGRHMLHGSFWMILLRWTIRLIGLVSTVILARLLTPADFGVVAMAMIVVGMLEILSQSGQRLAIIRLAHPTKDDYDTAWTISVFVGLTIGACILAIAPFTEAYFHEPSAVVVMRFLALRSILGGFENIGVVDFRRDIRFDRFFRYNAIPKAVSFVVTVSLAWYLRNYWALVAGIITSQITSTILSYAMHPYRPRFSLAKLPYLRAFSGWTLLRSIGIYLNAQMDQIAIGGIAGVSSMGRYSVASDVAASPSREINDPLITVLYSVLSKLQGEPTQLRALYLRAIGWSAVICTSTSVGVALVAPEMVSLVLGPKWHDVVPLMAWLALSAGTLGIGSGTYTLFDAIGKPHVGARMQWVRLILLAVAIFPAAILTRSLVAIAQVRLAVTLVFLPTLFFAAGREAGISARDYVSVLWRPLASAALMVLVVRLADLVIPLADTRKLAFDILVGIISYTGSLHVLWTMSGRPATPERDILGFLKSGHKKIAMLTAGSNGP